MNRNLTLWFLTALLMGGVIPAALATEQGGSSASTPTRSTTAPAPKIETAEGSISALDLQANSLKLTDANGKTWTLGIDPNTTTVWKGGQFIKLNQLKMWEQVKVRHVAKDGKQVAKSIEIEAPAGK